MDRSFVTSEGLTLELNVVSQTQLQQVALAVAAEFRKRGEPLDPPKYVTQMGEIVIWDAASVAKDGTDSDKEAWAKHEDARVRYERETNLKTLKAQIIKGIRPEDRTPSPEWVEEQTWLGVQLPDDPRDLSIAYVESEVLKTPDDIVHFTERIILMSMEGAVTEDEVAAIEATFRTALLDYRRPLPERFRVAADASNGKQGAAGVAVQLPDAGVAGGEDAGSKAERVPGVAGRRPRRRRGSVPV